MKTRKQIIEEILAENSKHNPADKTRTLEYALVGLQDALLYSLAQNLNISLDAEPASAVQS